MDSWLVVLEGLEFIAPHDAEGADPSHHAHVIQCPHGHYATLRTPPEQDIRALGGSIYCPRCHSDWSAPGPM